MDGKGIVVTRGDTARFVIRLTGRELAEGTAAQFTVKRTPWARERPVIEREIAVADGRVCVLLEPEDTDVEPGSYVWDLRVLEPAGGGRSAVLTPMEYASFQVREGIGNGH